MFNNAQVFNSNVSEWDTSQVNNMEYVPAAITILCVYVRVGSVLRLGWFITLGPC